MDHFIANTTDEFPQRLAAFWVSLNRIASHLWDSLMRQYNYGVWTWGTYGGCITSTSYYLILCSSATFYTNGISNFYPILFTCHPSLAIVRRCNGRWHHRFYDTGCQSDIILPIGKVNLAYVFNCPWLVIVMDPLIDTKVSTNKIHQSGH